MLRRPDMRIVLLVVFLLAMSTNPVFALFGIYIKALDGDIHVWASPAQWPRSASFR